MRTQPLVHDTINADMFTNIRQISRIGIASGDPLEEQCNSPPQGYMHAEMQDPDDSYLTTKTQSAKMNSSRIHVPNSEASHKRNFEGKRSTGSHSLSMRSIPKAWLSRQPPPKLSKQDSSDKNLRYRSPYNQAKLRSQGSFQGHDEETIKTYLRSKSRQVPASMLELDMKLSRVKRDIEACHAMLKAIC